MVLPPSDTIAAVVITCNEEEVIEECLRSIVDWVDEIIIVDMYSTDNTCDIASRFGARIIKHERLDWVEPARGFALRQASCNWILVLDPDERVSDALAKVLREAVTNADFDVLFLPYRNMAFGVALLAPGFAEVPHARFLRAATAEWPAEIHSLPKLEGLRCRMLKTPMKDAVIYHNTWRTIAQVLDKNRRYAPSDAVNLRSRGQEFSLSNLLLTPVYVVLNQFLRGKGYQDGMAGLLKVALLAVYHFTVYAELWELENRPAVFDRRIVRWGRVLAQPYRLFTPIEDLIIYSRKKALNHKNRKVRKQQAP